MAKRANGEGSLYTTIQKKKRKSFDPRGECSICKTCTDRTACENRTGYIKCQKCKDCKKECLIYCDRFYCNEYTYAQATIKGKQKTIATGKKQREVNKKKTENLAKIDNGKYIDKNKITLSMQLKNFADYSLQIEQVGDTGYTRKLDAIKSIEKKCPDIASKKIQELTEDDILEILRKHKDKSQSLIEKCYDVIKSSLNKAIKDKLLSEDQNPIKDIERDDILSNKESKKAIPFTIDETQKLIEYINDNEYSLINSSKSLFDSLSMKNLIKLSLAFGTRCGELCSIDIDKHINFKDKKIRVERTLTRNLQQQIIIGQYTKTGKKAKKRGDRDIRDVPFGIIYDENDVEDILKEQIEIAKAIPNNKDNLLFCNIDGSYVDVKHITCMFKRICRQAGIKLDLITGCHIHMTKHTVVTRLIEYGMNIYAISKLVGTSRRVLEKTYAHILDDFVDREIEKTKEKRLEHQFNITETPDIKRASSNIIAFPKRKTV